MKDNKLKFRYLKPDEIEVRVSTINEKGASLLLYKDARCDMNILDETVGMFGWQRQHTRDNANCIVSIYNEATKEWISKEDTGTESNAEAKKGLASDSFKRACFNWGIGRELYTAPFIWISMDLLEKAKLNNKTGKWSSYDKFTVSSIEIEDGKIKSLVIENQSGKQVYPKVFKNKAQPKTQETTKDLNPVSKLQIAQIQTLGRKLGLDVDKLELRISQLKSKEDAQRAITDLKQKVKDSE